MTQTLADIRISATLIDDYLHVRKPPILSGNLAGRFGVVQPAGAGACASELVTVAAGGAAVKHFRPDTGSESGWDTDTWTPDFSGNGIGGGEIEQIAAFYDGETLNVLAGASNGDGTLGFVWGQRAAAGGDWQDAGASGELGPGVQAAIASAFQLGCYTDEDARTFLYGVDNQSSGSFFVIARAAPGEPWQVATMAFGSFPVLPRAGASTFKLDPTATAGCDFRVAWCVGATLYYCDAGLVWPNGKPSLSWAGEPASFDPGIGDFDGPRWIDLPPAPSTDRLLLRDNNGNLVLFGNYTDDDQAFELPLTGATNQPASVSTVHASRDGSGTTRLFALEAGQTPRLWYLPVLPSSPDSPSAWVNLGSALQSIAAPLQSRFGPELFLVDLDTDVMHMVRTVDAATPADATNQVWVTRKVAEPTDASDASVTPANVASYNMEVMAVDSNGTPVPSQVLTLSCDHATTVLVDGLAHQIDPSSRIKVQTDIGGQAVVKIQAMDLKPPLVTLSAGSISRACRGDQVQPCAGETPAKPLATSVCARLQGQDPTRPLTTAALQAPTPTPQNPQIKLQPLMAPSYQPTKDGDATGAIKAMGQWIDPAHQASDGTLITAGLTTPHWRLDFSDPAGPVFTVLGDDEARALTASAPPVQAAMLAPDGSFLGHLFGDIAHFFKHVWNELTHFATWVDDGLHILFNDAIHFVIKTVKEAGEALETVFSRIVEGLKKAYDAVKDAIEWLKTLFDWQDILHTHEVLKQVFLTTLDNFAGIDIDTAKTQISKFFDGLEDKVNTALGGTDKVFGSASFNDYANNQASAATLRAAGALPAAGGNLLAATSLRDAHHAHASQCNYVQGKTKANAECFSSTTAAAAEADSPCGPNPLSNLTDDLIDAFTTKAKGAASYAQGQQSDAGNLFDLGIVDILKKIVEELLDGAIQTAEKLLLAVLDIIACALGKLRGILTAAIHIPVISWLYTHVITDGDQLTILDVLCLAMAVPTTIIYKLFNDDRAPFAAGDAQSVANGLPFPTHWPDGTPLLLASRSLAGEPATLSDQVLAALGFSAGILSMFNAFLFVLGDLAAIIVCNPEVGSVSKPLDVVISFLSLVAYAAQIGLAGPGVCTAGIAGEQASVVVSAGFWSWLIGSGLPWLVDVIMFTMSRLEVELKDQVGPIVDSAFGALALGLGIWAAVEQAHETDGGLDVALDVVAPFGCCFRFMAAIPDNAGGWLWMWTADLLGTLATGALQIALAADQGNQGGAA